jgi:hypothetical protein
MRDKCSTIELSKAEFDSLLEYSSTLPTGTTIGKKWKKRSPAFDDGKPADWYLGEYVEEKDESYRKKGYVGIIWKKIVVKS